MSEIQFAFILGVLVFIACGVAAIYRRLGK